MKKFAVFASGFGGNLQAIIDATKKKKIAAQLSLVICDKAGAFALERAKKAGISSIYINPKEYATREAFDKAIIQILKKEKIDFIVLAGYMRLLSKVFIDAYKNKILNIHPSLLPSFKGVSGIRDAFDYGVKVTGVSVHFVSLEMDAGAIIDQEIVRITDKDTVESLSKKIHAVEHKLYPRVIDLMAKGKLNLVGRKVLHQTRVSHP